MDNKQEQQPPSPAPQKPKKVFLPAISQDKIDYIKQNYLSMTDAQISRNLGVSAPTVKKYRQKFNLAREQNVAPSKIAESPILNKGSINKSNLTNDEKQKLWVKYYKATEDFKRIARQFNLDDLETFCQLWGKYATQFEDLSPTEQATIENVITYDIRIIHNRRQYTELLDQETLLRKRMGNRRNEELDVENTEDMMLWEMVNSNNLQQREITKQYLELTSRQEDLLKSLNATREQREQNTKIGADTFLTLVRQFNDLDKRAAAGKYNELMKIATNNQLKKLKQDHTFLDGTTEPIVMVGKDYVKKENKNE